MVKIILPVLAIVILVSYNLTVTEVYAQSPDQATSDFALDVAQGEQQVAADPDAQAQQQEVANDTTPPQAGIDGDSTGVTLQENIDSSESQEPAADLSNPNQAQVTDSDPVTQDQNNPQPTDQTNSANTAVVAGPDDNSAPDTSSTDQSTVDVAPAGNTPSQDNTTQPDQSGQTDQSGNNQPSGNDSAAPTSNDQPSTNTDNSNNGGQQ